MSQTIAASETMLGRAPLGRGRALVVRLALTAGALVVWFWTQSMIGARGLDGGAIHDRLHTGLAHRKFLFARPSGDGQCALDCKFRYCRHVGYFSSRPVDLWRLLAAFSCLGDSARTTTA